MNLMTFLCVLANCSDKVQILVIPGMLMATARS